MQSVVLLTRYLKMHIFVKICRMWSVFTVVVRRLPVLVLVIPTPGLELRGLAVVPVPPLVSRPQSTVRRRD